MTGLRPLDRDILLSMSDVWETAAEVRTNVYWNTKRGSDHWEVVGALRRLRGLGLVDYRGPGGGWGVLTVGEWAITPEGDRVAEGLTRQAPVG